MDLTDQNDAGTVRRYPRTVILLLVGALVLVAHQAITAVAPPPPPGPVRGSGFRRLRRVDPRVAKRSAVSPPTEAAPEDPAPREVADPIEPPPDAPAAEPVTDPAEPVTDPAELRLTRIVFDPGDPEARFAVIDGRAVRAGDRMGGWRVFRVERDRVRLGNEGEVVLTPSAREH